jgi:hypothetical protein
MTAGVYKLIFGTEVYIGRSSNIEQRYKGHISDISLKKSSKKLINAYQKYGRPKLEILEEEVSLDRQKVLEVEYIENLDTFNNGLNSTLGGEDILYGELNAACKYTNSQIYSVLHELAYSLNKPLEDISIETGVGINTVKEISAGTKHLWLASEYPEEYTLLLSNKPYRKERSLANLTDKFRFKPKLAEYPKVLSPSKEVFSIDGSLSAFAKEHGLQIGNLSSVINGRRKSHKGWELYKGEIS